MQRIPLSFRGRFYTTDFRGQLVARGWRQPMPKQADHPVTREQNTGFAKMVAYQAMQPWHAIESAKLIAAQSGYTWRDVVARALVGRLFQLASDNLQAVLDALDEISLTPGSMLFRNTTGWMAVIPEYNDSVLQVDSSGLPSFQQLFQYLSPSEGTMLVYHDGDWKLVADGDDTDVLTWDSASNLPAWQQPTSARKYTLGCFVPGVLVATQTLLMHKMAKAITTPANFGAFAGLSSEGGLSTPPTASAVIDVSRALNATPTSFSSVGAISFAAGAVSASFTTVSGAPISWAQGDVLRLQGPAMPDPTLADFSATLVGEET